MGDSLTWKSGVVADDGGIDQPGGPELPPGQLIASLFGLYAREHDGWLSAASVVRLMSDLGVTEPLTRSALSRLKRRELLHSRRHDGRPGYALSASSVRMLADGDTRIFGRRRARTTDGWLLVVFSVPEQQRSRRHVLRTSLSRLGFGMVNPGTWIAPAHIETEMRAALHRNHLTEYVDIFRAELSTFGRAEDKIAEWWALDDLTAMYQSFIDAYRPIAAHSESSTDEQAFRIYVPMLTAWRRLPYSDPGLPLDLLPDPWAGSMAEDLFEELDQKLRAPALDHARRRFVE